MPSSPPRIAYTDVDRYEGVCTETAILDEYKRLKLPAVRAGDVLLSPALARLLAEVERREDAASWAADGLRRGSRTSRDAQPGDRPPPGCDQRKRRDAPSMRARIIAASHARYVAIGPVPPRLIRVGRHADHSITSVGTETRAAEEAMGPNANEAARSAVPG
jgi:hypothetical protein